MPQGTRKARMDAGRRRAPSGPRSAWAALAVLLARAGIAWAALAVLLASAGIAAAAPAPAEAWRTDLGRALGAAIAADADWAYAGTLDGRIGAVALADGRRRWRVRRDGGLPGGVVLEGGRLLAASDEPDGRLYCLAAATGETLWRADVGPSLGPPLAHGDRVLCGSLPGRVTACGLESGAIIWQRPAPGQIRAPLAAAGGLVLVPTVADTLVALDAATGDFAWGVSPGGALYGRPLVDRDGVWTLSHEGVLSCWDPSSGELLRRARLDGTYRTGPVRAGPCLVALSTGGGLCAVDAATLTVRWRAALAGAGLREPVADGEVLWVALGDRSLRAVGALDGRQVARHDFRRPPTTGPVRAGEGLLLGLASGELVRLRPGGAGATGGVAAEPDPGRDRAADLTLWQRGALRIDPGGAAAAGGRLLAAADDPGLLTAPPPGGGPILIDGRGARGPRLAGWGRMWAAGWIAGTGLSLWLQHEAEQAHGRYEVTGDPRERGREFDRAERYDRAALGVWVAAEVMFVLMVRCWLSEVP